MAAHSAGVRVATKKSTGMVRRVPTPPGILHEYQKKGVVVRGVCKSIRIGELEKLAAAGSFEMEFVTLAMIARSRFPD